MQAAVAGQQQVLNGLRRQRSQGQASGSSSSNGAGGDEVVPPPPIFGNDDEPKQPDVTSSSQLQPGKPESIAILLFTVAGCVNSPPQ